MSSCCVAITTFDMPTGVKPSYSTVTCDFPSGLSHGRVPFFRTSASFSVKRCDSCIGKGMSSGVSLQANPNINP